MKEFWKIPALEILDVSNTFKGWEPPDKGDPDCPPELDS
ncbi:paeninodin family lasso peptide [Metabacillus indicus]